MAIPLLGAFAYQDVYQYQVRDAEAYADAYAAAYANAYAEAVVEYQPYHLERRELYRRDANTQGWP